MDDGHGRFIPLPDDVLQDVRNMTVTDPTRDALMEKMRKLQEAQKQIEEAHPEHGAWFTRGEIVELKGSRFIVKSIKPHGLYLKLLPKEE